MVYLIMGVSGSGKTTIGRLLGQRLGLPFHDADDFHSESNVDKMQNGIALTDEDREAWLETLADHLAQWEKEGGAVLACSALKEKYRQTLSSKLTHGLQLIFLKGARKVIRRRLSYREQHFMDNSLLDSQFDTLEEPDYGIVVSILDSTDVVVDNIIAQLQPD